MVVPGFKMGTQKYIIRVLGGLVIVYVVAYCSRGCLMRSTLKSERFRLLLGLSRGLRCPCLCRSSWFLCLSYRCLGGSLGGWG